MRVTGEPAYILHHRDYSETSQVLDVFTPRHGRLGLLAKGARRPSSPWRGLLKPFHPLLIGWTGRGELPILTQAESNGDSLVSLGATLYCGFYLNELLLRLLHRHDPHERLFTLYSDALTRLGNGMPQEPVLRHFEKRLLDEIGYGLVLDHDVGDNSPLQPESLYDYRLDRGPLKLANPDLHTAVEGMRIRGRSLLALANDNLDTDAVALREAKQLMRMALDSHLGGRPLHTRTLFRSIITPRAKALLRETGT
jgi:DNA repair protein RecO (recombination protein O)